MINTTREGSDRQLLKAKGNSATVVLISLHDSKCNNGFENQMDWLTVMLAPRQMLLQSWTWLEMEINYFGPSPAL